MRADSAAPGPSGRYPWSHLVAIRRDALGFLTRIAREHGDVVRFRLGMRQLFLLNHPDLIRDVLVTDAASFKKGHGLERAKRLLGEGLLTSEGAFHLRQRRMIQPPFHHDRIAAYSSVMVEYAERVGARWRDGDTVDVAQEMMGLTMSIVGKTLLDADLESEVEGIREAFTIAYEMFDRVYVPFAELLEKLPLPSSRRFRRARGRLDATIHRLIEERRRETAGRTDLLTILLLAQDREGHGGGMTNEQLRDEVMTIFLAGHETTANALTWTWLLLSRHPDVEARLHAELDEILAGRLPALEDLPLLPYTRKVLAESMRLYPPAWIIGRRALKDHRAGGHTIPAGSIVVMSQYLMHRDPRFFSDPERFDPERFTPEAQAARPRYAYFPFGGGPRVCVGEGFAWMEGILALATLGRQWSLRLVPEHPIALAPLITLRPKFGVRMTLRRRGR